jgi:hypothetical protein
MTIGYNRGQFFGKVIILTIMLSMVALFLYYRPPIKFDHAPIGGIIFLAVIWSLLALFLLLMTLQLFFLPNGVDIDETNRVLILKFVFGRQTILQLNDLSAFSSIAVVTKSSRYEGLLLKTANSKEYVLGNFNLEDFRPIKTFLENANVAFIGHEKFSFISYFLKFFRP